MGDDLWPRFVFKAITTQPTMSLTVRELASSICRGNQNWLGGKALCTLSKRTKKDLYLFFPINYISSHGTTVCY